VDSNNINSEIKEASMTGDAGGSTGCLITDNEDVLLLNQNSVDKLKLSDIKTVPNLLTLSRIILLPFLILSLIEYNNTGIVLLPVVIGSVMLFTDIIDGWIAGILEQRTTLGSIIDPVSDKIIIIVLGFTLFFLGYMSIHVLWVLLLRDFFLIIFGFRSIKRFGCILKTNIIARITPLTWGLFYILVVLKQDMLSRLICVAAILLTLVSGVIYWNHYVILSRKAKL